MTMLDLFAGIGGFSLAARWTGIITTIGFCEIDPFCRRVLTKNFPGVPIHDDIRTLTGAIVRTWLGGGSNEAAVGVPRNTNGGVASEVASVRYRQNAESTGVRAPLSRCLDLITGGYPCQPFSQAGRRLGQEDDRHLWPEMRRLIAELRPAWIVGENVAGHISLGLDHVLADLEALDYACWPLVVPACAVNAPHRRDRIWVVAHAGRGKSESGHDLDLFGRWQKDAEQVGLCGGGIALADANRQRQSQPGRIIAQERRWLGDDGWWEAERGLGGIADGVSAALDGPERVWGAGWEDGVNRTTAAELARAKRLKALGNAIVPQVAYEILCAIVQREVPA